MATHSSILAWRILWQATVHTFTRVGQDLATKQWQQWVLGKDELVLLFSKCGPWTRGNGTGVDCHFLLQGIFPTQGSNPGLQHCRQMLYRLSHQGSPEGKKGGAKPCTYKGESFPMYSRNHVCQGSKMEACMVRGANRKDFIVAGRE